MRVINLRGTGTRTCRCGSWIRHWHRYSGQQANICRAKGCSNFANVGAHVKKVQSPYNFHFIVPFCHHHNSVQNKPIELVDGTVLVSANVSQTCGRWTN